MTEFDKPRATLSGAPPEPGYESSGAPAPIDPATGQHRDYWVLPENERRRGFVRPLRDTYRHVGQRPKNVTRPLTPSEVERYHQYGYVLFEESDEGLGRYWTRAQLNSGCGAETKMGPALAETYARDPSYYGSTFCCYCSAHFPVAEFVWTSDGEVVGS